MRRRTQTAEKHRREDKNSTGSAQTVYSTPAEVFVDSDDKKNIESGHK